MGSADTCSDSCESDGEGCTVPRGGSGGQARLLDELCGWQGAAQGMPQPQPLLFLPDHLDRLAKEAPGGESDRDEWVKSVAEEELRALTKIGEI